MPLSQNYSSRPRKTSKPGQVLCKGPNHFKGTFVVNNDRGLHTRPSTEIVRCAVGYKSEISLAYQSHHVNAKSILGVLMLAAERGAKILVEAKGGDAEAAVRSLLDLAEQNFKIKY